MGAEYLFGAFPEAIKERLSHIKREQYDAQTLKGLDSHDPDWIDHGNGLITYQERIYIPRNSPSNSQLRTDIIREHHDSQSAGHSGRFRDYWWPRIQGAIRKYIDGCIPLPMHQTSLRKTS